MKNPKRIGATICLFVAVAISGSAQTVKKLSRAEAMAAVIAKVPPVFPVMARQLKIEGVVELEVTLTENGQVDSVNIISGNPVLTRPAADALKKWKFAPQTEDGKPSRALAPISVSFKL